MYQNFIKFMFPVLYLVLVEFTCRIIKRAAKNCELGNNQHFGA